MIKKKQPNNKTKSQQTENQENKKENFSGIFLRNIDKTVSKD